MMINKMNRTTNNAKPPANTSPISKSTSYKTFYFSNYIICNLLLKRLGARVRKRTAFGKSDPFRLTNVSCTYDDKQYEQYYEQRETV